MRMRENLILESAPDADGRNTGGYIFYDAAKDSFDVGALEYGGTVIWEEFDEWVKAVYAARAARCR